MTPERIAELRALAEAATPEPWGRLLPDAGGGWVVFRPGFSGYLFETDDQEDQDIANTDFVVAARSALPEALNEIERLWLYIESKKMREGQ